MNELHDLCGSGDPSCLKKIQNILDSDPRKNLRDTDDPEHIINQKGSNFQTPLFIAIKNGNYEIVKFLIERGANPFCNSLNGPKQEENNLTVAVRWR